MWTTIIMTRNKQKLNGKEKENEEDKEEGIDENIVQSQSRMELIQEEFGLSDLEVGEINKFILSTKKNTGILDVLKKLIKCEDLNVRQKVAFAHVMWIFRTEGNTTTSGNRTVTIDVSECRN